MAVGEVDGEPVVIILGRAEREWIAQRVVRLELSDHRIIGIADYSHCPWVLSAAGSVVTQRDPS
jgi:RNA polymerase sigma-70 factor, ECF subfamily